MPHPERTILGWQVPHQYSYNYTRGLLCLRICLLGVWEKKNIIHLMIMNETTKINIKTIMTHKLLI